MTVDPRYHKSHTVSFAVPDRYERTFSFAESDWTYEPSIAPLHPSTAPVIKISKNVKTFKRSWDPDKALKSTYKGLFGKYQLRAYIFLALGYGIIAAWLTEMPTFALLPPKYIDCTPYYPNLTNQSFIGLNGTTLRALDKNFNRIVVGGQIQRIEPVYNYSKEYGRSFLTDSNTLCDKTRSKIPYITYITGLILGALVFGCLADHSGRKMILLGSMWTACALSIFQLLSDDYISYVFFILFIGIAIGAVHVIAISYVMEMFPSESRAIYGISLLGIALLFDLVIPWFALLIKNWKILQGVISIPIIITSILYWFTEESMFWYTSQKDYLTAVLSLTKIADFNGIVFEDVFHGAKNFLRGKRSVGIQCDFQPLLRLQDIGNFGTQYPDYDMVDLQAVNGKKNSLTHRILQVVRGHHYYPTLSTFYPTDIFHSSILTIYLLVMCGLWFVSSLTEYSLDTPHLTQYLTDNFFYNYFYTRLIQIVSFIIAVPLVYKWGRRWPTFCFFLIAEVCLLGSVAVKLDDQQIRPVMLMIYFIGKFATRAAYIVIVIYTCELFPTGLRCTTLGICYTFRFIGMAIASKDVGEINDWMARLIYGILSLILGAMALLLPETKRYPLARTMIQIEMIPTSISQHFRRQRAIHVKRNVQPDGTRPEKINTFNDMGSLASGVRSIRPYDNQSTLHSIYELQDFTQDDTVHSMCNRYPPRRIDSRNPAVYQPYIIAGGGGGTGNSEPYRQHAIAEDVEYDVDVDDDRTRVAFQRRLSEQKQQQQLAIVPSPVVQADDDAVSLPVRTSEISIGGQSSSGVPSQLEITPQMQARDVTEDRSELTTTTDETKDNNNQNEKLSSSPKFQRGMSEDENYFSEHC